MSDLEAQTVRIQRLEDLEAIKRLQYRYFRAMTDGDHSTLEGTLTEGAVTSYPDGKHVFYDRAGLGMSPEARAAIDHYIETHPRGRHGKVIYDLEGDFGIEREAMYEVFANYMEAFPVQRETPNA